MTDTARRWLRRVPAWVPLTVMAALVAIAAVWAAVDWWDWLRGPEPLESGGATLRNFALVSVAIVGLPLALWRNLTAYKQAETAARGLRNERYQKGADMLGNATLATRLGGVYALEQLAREHPEEYHVPIVDLLCAFIRHPVEEGRPESGGADGGGLDDPAHEAELRCAPHIEAAAQAIGRRRVENDPSGFFLNLRGAHLEGADLRNAKLSGAFLWGAFLWGANLQDANLEDANLEEAHLEGANLWRAILRDAHLEDADLSRALLLGTHLEGAHLEGAHLEGAHLGGAYLEGAHLEGAYLEGANLEGANLEGARLSGARLSDANLQGANLSRANLWGTILRGADLSRANLSGAKLGRANLSDANLEGTDLEGAELEGADLSRANLSGVKGLKQSELDKAFIREGEDPPQLGGALDAETGEPLVWQGEERPPEDEAGD